MKVKMIPISGSQGCGKTTVIKQLSDNGWKVDNFQVSRYVQTQIYKVDSLSAVLTNPFSVMAFQELILRHKYEHDLRLLASEVSNSSDIKDKIIFTERSFVDIQSYAALWLTRFMDNEIYYRWLKSYTTACAVYQKRLYDENIFLSPIDHWENDPLRAEEKDKEIVNSFMMDFFKENSILIINVGKGTPEQRYNTIQSSVNSLFYKKD